MLLAKLHCPGPGLRCRQTQAGLERAFSALLATTHPGLGHRLGDLYGSMASNRLALEASVSGRPNVSHHSRACCQLGGRKQAKRWRKGLIVCQSTDTDVVIVGAGIAGLACGLHLAKQGISFKLLEASPTVGGRVQTDEQDGFLLDRGFQIFLTSYPEAQAVLDYRALDLKPFYAGAEVWWNGDFHRVADPARHLLDGLLSLGNPVGSPVDKVRVGLYRIKVLLRSWEDVLSAPETSTMQRLKAEGFTEAMIQRFFQPFLGGIFFDRSLRVTSRLFDFVMRCLATGSNCLPAAGIGAVPQQMAARLPQGSVRTGCRVEAVTLEPEGQVVVGLEDGSSVLSRAVVVATEAQAAQQLLGSALEASPSQALPGVATCCLYFSAKKPPRPEPMLYLNGERGTHGLINNICFPSTIAPSYAPPGQTLVSVSTVGAMDKMGEKELARAVLNELSDWFGPEVSTWQFMRCYRIPFAQPNQAPPTDFQRPVALGKGLFVCGDHRDCATLNGALVSGRRAATAVSQHLQAQPAAASTRELQTA